MHREAWQATVHKGYRAGHNWSDLACLHAKSILDTHKYAKKKMLKGKSLKDKTNLHYFMCVPEQRPILFEYSTQNSKSHDVQHPDKNNW